MWSISPSARKYLVLHFKFDTVRRWECWKVSSFHLSNETENLASVQLVSACWLWPIELLVLFQKLVNKLSSTFINYTFIYLFISGKCCLCDCRRGALGPCKGQEPIMDSKKVDSLSAGETAGLTLIFTLMEWLLLCVLSMWLWFCNARLLSIALF